MSAIPWSKRKETKARYNLGLKENLLLDSYEAQRLKSMLHYASKELH